MITEVRSDIAVTHQHPATVHAMCIAMGRTARMCRSERLSVRVLTIPGVQLDSSAATCGFAVERASDLRRRPFPIFQRLAALGGKKSLGSPSDRAVKVPEKSQGRRSRMGL